MHSAQIPGNFENQKNLTTSGGNLNWAIQDGIAVAVSLCGSGTQFLRNKNRAWSQS
jgi:hypothetical protein